MCDDKSTFSGILFNVEFAMIPVKKSILSRQWQVFFDHIQNEIHSIYNRFNVTMQFNDNQIKSVQLELCSLQVLSGL